MSVQDDERERELVRVFNLAWDPAHQRAGVDAMLDIAVEGRTFRLDIEVKSTTGETVSTPLATWASNTFSAGVECCS